MSISSDKSLNGNFYHRMDEEEEGKREINNVKLHFYSYTSIVPNDGGCIERTRELLMLGQSQCDCGKCSNVTGRKSLSFFDFKLKRRRGKIHYG